jgi:hypothetical protein
LNVEPYVSFRWLVAGVFGAMGVQALLALWLQIRDLARGGNARSPREEQLVRMLKRHAALLALRALSFETGRRHAALLLQIALLFAAAVGLNVWIFRFE